MSHCLCLAGHPAGTGRISPPQFSPGPLPGEAAGPLFSTDYVDVSTTSNVTAGMRPPLSMPARATSSRHPPASSELLRPRPAFLRRGRLVARCSTAGCRKRLSGPMRCTRSSRGPTGTGRPSWRSPFASPSVAARSLSASRPRPCRSSGAVRRRTPASTAGPTPPAWRR